MINVYGFAESPGLRLDVLVRDNRRDFQHYFFIVLSFQLT